MALDFVKRSPPDGEVRAAAEAKAREIARFPQEAVRADRNAIIGTRGMPVRQALLYEWGHGLEAITNEGVAGAGRFRDGAGRSGSFGNN